jgi:hypothetical protein
MTGTELQHYETVGIFNVNLVKACTAGLMLLAGTATAYYNVSRLSIVGCVLSTAYFLSGFAKSGLVDFRKKLNLRQEVISIFARRIITFIANIAAALLLKSYSAMLVGITLSKVVSLAMSNAMNDFQQRFILPATRTQCQFTKRMSFNICLGFLMHDGCSLTIGRIFGSSGCSLRRPRIDLFIRHPHTLAYPRLAQPGRELLSGTGETHSFTFRNQIYLKGQVLPLWYYETVAPKRNLNLFMQRQIESGKS